MPNETDERPGSSSLLPVITRLIDSSVKQDAGLDNLITILSLLCLISVFTRQQTSFPASSPANSAKEKESPVNKLIDSLMKGGEASSTAGGLGPETLMSLLPLLNSPQVKSKLNPSTISSMLGVLNNLGNPASEKHSSPKEKKETNKETSSENKKEKKEEPAKESLTRASGINAQMSQDLGGDQESHPEEDFALEDSDEYDSKNQGRYLNWKTNF